MSELINIQTSNGALAVSSKDIAEHFGKRHDGVLRDIENLIAKVGSPQNWVDLFIEADYQQEQNKQTYKQYLLTRDGFSLLVMGFTGAKALEWKLKYIKAFNEMEHTLKTDYSRLSPQTQAFIGLELRHNELSSVVTSLRSEITDLKKLIGTPLSKVPAPTVPKISATPITWKDGMLVKMEMLQTEKGVNLLTLRGQLYKKLEQICNCNLAVKVCYLRDKSSKAGMTYREVQKLGKLDVIERDAKLRTEFDSLFKEYLNSMSKVWQRYL